jgi:UDP-N-acetylglucosamine/UDP-N-acetylgalactosamine 4-epimerase
MNTYAEPQARINQEEERLKDRPRTWLVTGCAGFIGSHLAERLLELGQHVVGLDNFSTGKPENLAHVKNAVGGEKWKRLRFIEGDIRKLADCREACREVELVLHEAALGSVPRSIDDPLATTDNNVMGFLNMLVAARDAGVARFVYASSSAVFGDHPAMPKIEPQIGRAVSPYGLSKHVNELYAEVFARCYGFEAIGLRYFNVFGARQDANGAYPSVIPAFVSALLRGQTAYINGDGSFSRDFCYIDNVVQANLLAATVEAPEALNQAYNVALGGETTLNELFEMIRTLVARRLPGQRGARPVYREVRKGDLPYTRADIGKASRLLGFDPRVSVMQGLERTVDWYAGALDAETPQRKVAHA